MKARGKTAPGTSPVDETGSGTRHPKSATGKHTGTALEVDIARCHLELFESLYM